MLVSELHYKQESMSVVRWQNVTVWRMDSGQKDSGNHCNGVDVFAKETPPLSPWIEESSESPSGPSTYGGYFVIALPVNFSKIFLQLDPRVHRQMWELGIVVTVVKLTSAQDELQP